MVVKERTDSAVSLLATGFARQANVEFTVTVGGCTGRSSMVATADALLAQFAITPSCAGPATATAKAGAQSATTSFVIDNPNGGVTAAPSPGRGPPRTATAATAAAVRRAGRHGHGRAGPASGDVEVHGPGQRRRSVPAVKAGDTVCFTGALPNRLEHPWGRHADGAGRSTPEWVRRPFPGSPPAATTSCSKDSSPRARSDNGIYVSGNNITVQDNDISSVNIGSDDVDAMRFFGNNITIQHNFSHDIWANESKGGAPHTDCMQTYTSDSESASSNIKILNNKCASAQFHQCLMAEGPHDDDGDGQGNGVGQSANWTIAGNYFECHAPAQTVALQDIQNVTFSDNNFAGSGSKAIALQKRASGATVTGDNVKGPGYRELVGIDDASARQGFKGPIG